MLCVSDTFCVRRCAALRIFLILLVLAACLSGPMMAQEQAGGEASLKLPDLRSATFWGINGHNLLLGGLLVSALGLVFGLMIFVRLKKMPVHVSMLEVSELIYETCKTYLATQ